MVDSVASALATAGPSTGDTSRASLAENFEMFLVLLTEQLKNQDPLSPLDSNQFVTQLVQFSGVEQQIKQSDALQTLIGLQVASVGGAAVGYLGKEIRVDSMEAPLTAAGADWAFSVEGDAESVSIAVLDETGKLVFQAEGPTEPGEHGFHWAGQDSAGNTLPPGVYTLSVAAASAEGDGLPVKVASFGIVTGVDLSGTEPVLLMGKALAPFSRIIAVREPAPPPPSGDGNV
jgi:flagellar basal-body rod modification protein FlgD